MTINIPVSPDYKLTSDERNRRLRSSDAQSLAELARINVRIAANKRRY